MKKIYTYEIKYQVVKAKGSFTYWANKQERFETESPDQDSVLKFWEDNTEGKKRLVSIKEVRIHVPA